MEYQKMFTDKLVNGKLDFSDEQVIDYFFALPFPTFILQINNLSTENLNQIINHPEKIMSLPLYLFKSFFLKIPQTIKIRLLEREDIFTTVITDKPNKYNNTILDLLEYSVQINILSYVDRIDRINPGLIQNFLQKMDESKFEESISLLETTFQKHYGFDLSQGNEQQQEMVKYLQEQFDVTSEIGNSFCLLLQQKKRNPYYLFTIENKDEFFMYYKFDLLMNIKERDNISSVIELEDEHIYKKSLLEYINEKHMTILIKKLMQDNPDANRHKIFVDALHLYSVFGFDNALKIIDQKFTYINNISLKRAAETFYIDAMREYRVAHQDEFYNCEMLKDCLDALRNKNTEFFKNICVEKEESHIHTFMDTTMKLLETEEEENQPKFLEFLIKKEIDKRQQNRKEASIEEYVVNYYKKNEEKRKPLTYLDIYEKFKNINIGNIELDGRGHVKINEKLNRFLLGNCKANNDCLLRLIWNNEAFGLNNTIANTINSFDKIDKIAKKAKVSLYSILDVIDICKCFLYHLAPNEQDMTLDTISKIIKSRKHCTESEEEVLLKTKILHLERRKKVSSTIPTASGTTAAGVRYEVLPYDSPKLITVGIDTGSCLKVGGKGEDFLRYLLTNPNSVMVGIYDQDGHYYICPFIRNGNTIYGNGIDPEPAPDHKQDVLNAVKECCQKIIEKSMKNEKIELATITDLNMSEWMHHQGVRNLPITQYLPIDAVFYSDYHKKEIKSYEIASTQAEIEPVFYKPKHYYQQDRNPNYIYHLEGEKDKIGIDLLLNSIAYSSIDFLNVSDREKNKSKREFTRLDIEKFECIIGNKDWFVGIDNNMHIISYLLPYDARAKTEYLEAFSSLKDQAYGEKEQEDKYVKGM